MGVIDDYLAYLRDNPEGYWFKRKPYGYGWTPARWQGWAVLGGYLAFVFGVIFLSPALWGEQAAEAQLVWPLLLATILFLVITWRTGEPLKWQWGMRNHTRTK